MGTISILRLCTQVTNISKKKHGKTLLVDGNRINVGVELSANLHYVFTDDQLIIQETKDKLQTAVYQFHPVFGKYNMKIFVSNTKQMAYRRAEAVR